jgi:hypothetical protein
VPLRSQGLPREHAGGRQETTQACAPRAESRRGEKGRGPQARDPSRQSRQTFAATRPLKRTSVEAELVARNNQIREHVNAPIRLFSRV